MKKFEDYPIKILSNSDIDYPECLRKIKNAPRQIYYRGEISNMDFSHTLAIVGSRRMTRYGKDVVDKFVLESVQNNVVTVSGFMYGVDTEVHSKTVLYGGKTIAVFGCGLDIVYPPENKDLYTDILERGGVVISEYESHAKPHLWKFPRRNRIVVGLASRGVLVVEAGEKSGSLVTAELAIKNKKAVFAVPGMITSTVSLGTNKLIKEGRAKLVTSLSDILGGNKISKTIANKKNNNPILDILSYEPLSADEIAIHLGKNISEVSTELTLLMLSGDIKDEGGVYSLSKK